MKKLTKKILTALFALPALAVCPTLSGDVPSVTATVHASAAAEMATDLSLISLKDEQKLTLSSLYEEKPLYLNFWASWCPPCIGEMPHINEMHEKYGKQINFAAVSLDDTAAEALDFTRGEGVSLKIPFYYGDQRAIAQAYKINAIPVSIIIAKGGAIIDIHIGGMNAKELDHFISQAL